MTRKTQRSVLQVAASKALQTRLGMGVRLDMPASPFLACEDLGVEARFVDIPSLEGIYYNGRSATVLVSSCRPSGRKTSTCGHELGHHVLKHGTCVDEIRSKPTHVTDPREYAADVFSSFYLMPPALIRSCVSAGLIDRDEPSPVQIYRLSTYLDVSYEGLITHLSANLRMIARPKAEELLRVKLSFIRQQLIQVAISTPRILMVDASVPFSVLFAETGDLLFLSGVNSEDLLQSKVVDKVVEGIVWRFVRAGTVRLSLSADRTVVVSVRRSDFTGRARFQYLEDPDDE